MRRPALSNHLIGYARVSTDDQATTAQMDELQAAGCAVTHQEHGSGASRARPVMSRILREIRPDKVLVMVRLDRLARSVSHLLEVIEDLKRKGAHFRSLRDPIETSTPQGMFRCRFWAPSLSWSGPSSRSAPKRVSELRRPVAGAWEIQV